MAKLKKFLPHEQMMERFEKEGRVSRQELSLKGLTLDHRLQAREKPLDLDNVKELHSYVKNGQALAPIIVFRVDGKDYVTNGFHRAEVHRKEGLPSILADVVDGMWQEAVEFAACCNLANHALTPSKGDKKKAVFMLLCNEWLAKPYSVIAKHCGTTEASVKSWVAEYCEIFKVDQPKTKHRSDGRKMTSANAGGLINKRPNKRNSFRYTTSHGGRTTYLGTTEEEAQLAQERLLAESDSRRNRLSKTPLWKSYLATRGAVVFAADDGLASYVPGGRVKEYAITTMPEKQGLGLSHVHPSVSAIGRVVIIAEHFKLTKKVILVPDEVNGLEFMKDSAHRLGIEFMTLDQFVEAVKADEGELGDV